MPSSSLRSSTQAEETESLPLVEKPHAYGLLSVGQPSKITKALTCQRLYMFILHLLLATLVVLVLANTRSHDNHLIDGRTWSPAQEHIEYEINAEHTTNHSRYSKYSGPPSTEQDKAWDKLMLPVYFNASREELDKAGETFRGEDEAELVDGGYLVNLGVYHELHCLRQLRFYLFQERYYPSLAENQKEYIRQHLDHCLETLRLTIMCYGNTALYSFYWDEHNPAAERPVTKSNSKSVCIKWSVLEEWAFSRKVPTDPAFLKPRRHAMKS